MKKIVHFFETDKGKRIKNTLVCFGASVVLLGALFKIMHWPGAGAMLTAGMLTEVVLFALFGILPPHEDYHWEKLYPGLNIAPDLDPDFDEEAIRKKQKAQDQVSVTGQLDQALEEQKVTPEVVERLGENLKILGQSMERLSQSADASDATNEYSSKAKEAAAALEEMKSAYSNATNAMNELSTTSGDALSIISEDAQAHHEKQQAYHEEVQAVTKNLSALNAIYEVELQDTNSHLKLLNQYYGSLSEAMGNLSESVEDTKRYREGMSGLANNLSALNSIYGNMLSAMATGVKAQAQQQEV